MVVEAGAGLNEGGRVTVGDLLDQFMAFGDARSEHAAGLDEPH